MFIYIFIFRYIHTHTYISMNIIIYTYIYITNDVYLRKHIWSSYIHINEHVQLDPQVLTREQDVDDMGLKDLEAAVRSGRGRG